MFNELLIGNIVNQILHISPTPASSAILACSTLTTSIISPPLHMCAKPDFTVNVPSVWYSDLMQLKLISKYFSKYYTFIRN